MTSDHTKILTFPAKRFFVRVITRDISLEDCILDLLDNCVDGIDRISNGGMDYSGKYANITITEDKFVIEDNCGGIPPEIAIKYAFRFGRPGDRPREGTRSIGVYGIGMKRAIFKIGEKTEIITRYNDSAYAVRINDEWMNSEEWSDLKLENIDCSDITKGTIVNVEQIHDEVKEQFKSTSFVNNLKESISQHYALILGKGFSVNVNGAAIAPVELGFRWELPRGTGHSARGEQFAPGFWKADIDGVKVTLIAGYYGIFPSNEDVARDEELRNRSEKAGWTVICNDRIVLYCDKSYITGWGDIIPQYHTQFIGFSGVAIFESNDIEKLPLTTTKRGIEPGAKVFILTKKKLIELTKSFIDFTNKWKRNVDQARAITSRVEMVPLRESIARAEKRARIIRTGGIQFSPKLPMPEAAASESVQIRYFRSKTQVEAVASLLFREPSSVTPSDVGGACFDKVLEQAKK